MTSTTNFEVGSVFIKPMKDQYEKQVVYEARVRQAFQDQQKALPIRRETLQGYKLVYRSSELYDAEKEQFNITNPMYDALSNTGLGDQKFSLSPSQTGVDGVVDASKCVQGSCKAFK